MSLWLKLFFVCCLAVGLVAFIFRPTAEPQRPQAPQTIAVPDGLVIPEPHPWNAIQKLGHAEIAGMELALQENPEDLELRRQLLLFYGPKDFRVRPPSIDDQEVIVAARRRHILWMIEHHPDDPFLATSPALIFPMPMDPLHDAEGYAQAKALWLEHLDQAKPGPTLLSNAATFLEVADKPVTEEIYLKAMTVYPELKWSARLGRLYALVLMGSNAAAPGRVRLVSNEAANSDYAKVVRRKLDESKDTELLVTAGELLRNREYLERALELDPASARARQEIDALDGLGSQRIGPLAEIRELLRGMF
jgi:hypothetical protein